MAALRQMCAVAAAVLLVGVIGAPTAAAATLFVGDFETGNFNQWAVCQNVSFNSACADYTTPNSSMGVETDVVRQGRFAARFELGAGDSSAIGARAEVNGAGATAAGEGDERWYRWSTRFGDGFPANRGWSVVTQFHAIADGSPPVAFSAGPTDVGVGEWGLVLHTWNAPGDPGPVFVPWRAPVNPGVWNDITLHVGWSASDDSGFIEMWVGGAPQTFSGAPCAGQTRCQVRTLMPGGGGIYAKQGYYRNPSITATGVVYHDGFSIADTRDGLVPL